MAARRYRLDEVEPSLDQVRTLLRSWVDDLDDDRVAEPRVAALVAGLVAALGPAPTSRSTPEPPAPDAGIEPETVVARLVELVVLADDLARAVPSRPAPAVPRDALRIVVRSLLDALEAKAPGRAVEVRVPPFAAVQCIEGPRHTRGTPPNTVETDAVTWIRLASGRLTWAEAVDSHAVAVSGARADLAALLPLL